tara:strand:+ start:2833 stop:3132 length:300 start_codon:yes stop_codon:yes gene_type:complete
MTGKLNVGDYLKIILPIIGAVLLVWVRVEVALATHTERINNLEEYREESQKSKDETMKVLYEIATEIRVIKKNQERFQQNFDKQNDNIKEFYKNNPRIK